MKKRLFTVTFAVLLAYQGFVAFQGLRSGPGPFFSIPLLLAVSSCLGVGGILSYHRGASLRLLVYSSVASALAAAVLMVFYFSPRRISSVYPVLLYLVPIFLLWPLSAFLAAGARGGKATSRLRWLIAVLGGVLSMLLVHLATRPLPAGWSVLGSDGAFRFPGRPEGPLYYARPLSVVLMLFLWLWSYCRELRAVGRER